MRIGQYPGLKSPFLRHSIPLSQPLPGIVTFSGRMLKDQVEQHYPVAVVGGGIAGLTALYFLTRHENIPALLMESEKKLGGNSKSGKNSTGMHHPEGATIFLPGQDYHHKFWKELKLPLQKRYQLKPEIYVVDGERFTTFGTKQEQDELSPKAPYFQEAAKGFRKLLADLKRIANTLAMATIVPIYEATEKALDMFDDISMAKFLEPYGSGVRLLAEPYIKSDLAARSEDLSAYIGMIDLEDLNNPRYVLPGGNGFAIQRLKEEIMKSSTAKESPILTNTKVEWVEQDKDKVYIQYRDKNRKKHVISADAVLMGAPYNKVPSLMEVPRKVAKLMQALPKNTYAIVNIFLKKTPLKTYQFYMLPRSKYIADLVLTNARPDSKEKGPCDDPSVMSIYTAGTGRKNVKKFAQEIKAEIKQNFPEITEDMISDVKVVPFKYAMGAPSPGMVRQLKEMPKTFGRVTLINSDGGAVPSILTAVDEAINGVQIAVKKLKCKTLRSQ